MWSFAWLHVIWEILWILQTIRMHVIAYGEVLWRFFYELSCDMTKGRHSHTCTASRWDERHQELFNGSTKFVYRTSFVIFYTSVERANEPNWLASNGLPPTCMSDKSSWWFPDSEVGASDEGEMRYRIWPMCHHQDHMAQYTPGLRGQGEHADLELQLNDLVTKRLTSPQGLYMAIR